MSNLANATETYRRRLDALRAADAAVGALSNRLSDHRRWLFEIKAEHERVETSRWSPREDIRKAVAERLTELNVAAAEAQAEIDRLSAELGRLQERRGAAATLLARCRDYLRDEAGVAEKELAW